MESSTRDDIRRALKTFGIQADEAITAYLTRWPGTGPLRVRLSLAGLPETAVSASTERLQLEMEAEIRR